MINGIYVDMIIFGHYTYFALDIDVKFWHSEHHCISCLLQLKIKPLDYLLFFLELILQGYKSFFHMMFGQQSNLLLPFTSIAFAFLKTSNWHITVFKIIAFLLVYCPKSFKPPSFSTIVAICHLELGESQFIQLGMVNVSFSTNSLMCTKC